MSKTRHFFDFPQCAAKSRATDVINQNVACVDGARDDDLPGVDRRDLRHRHEDPAARLDLDDEAGESDEGFNQVAEQAFEALKGDDAATVEILRALKKTNGNMREACELLGVGKSSMYRLIKDLNAAAKVDALVAELDARIQGKDIEERRRQPRVQASDSKAPRLRVKRAAA